MRKTLSISVLTLSLVLIAGCAKPPTEQVDAARGLVDQARAAGAETYASDQWQAAQEAMNAVQAELDVQAGKLALVRSYRHTSELIAGAEEAAKAAQQAAVEGKEAARQAAEAELLATEESLTHASELIETLAACKRAPKGFSADLEQLRGNLDALNAEVAGIDEAIAGESYLQAETDARALGEKAATLVADLTSAREKLGC